MAKQTLHHLILTTLLLVSTMLLSGCEDGSGDTTGSAAGDGLSSTRLEMEPSIDDALIAPAQPELSVRATPGLLHFSWQDTEPDSTARLFEYDRSTGEESLIASYPAAASNNATIPAQTPARPWHTQQFRLEICTKGDCVSSNRIAIDSLVAVTAEVLKPAVFIRGERFAEAVATSHDARVIASTLPAQRTVQIHFHNEQRWVPASPVELRDSLTHRPTAIASSHSGDSIAVLMQALDAETTVARITVLERLGEAWIPTADIHLPENLAFGATGRIQMSDSGDQIYLHTTDALFVFRQEVVEWSMHSMLDSPSVSGFADSTVNADLTSIHTLQQLSGVLWLVSYQLPSGNEAPLWEETSRVQIQGVDPLDTVFVRADSADASIVIAGWDNTLLAERSPVLWRFRHAPRTSAQQDVTMSVADSLRMPPTADRTAELRFSVSDNLQTVALGYSAEASADASLSTFNFNDDLQHYQLALELPHTLSTLSKQSFAGAVVVSGDAKTLLIANLPDSSTPESNRAGELMIFR